jgi:hypothetical protein
MKRSMLSLTWTMAAAIAACASVQAQSANQPQITFTKDIAAIFQKNCQACHRAGSIGPMSLVTYEEARPWSRSIKQHVAQRDMPPWYIDKNVGIHDFKNDVSLSDEDIAKIVKWVDQGAPRGNAADMPPPMKFEDNDRWHIGTPDVIAKMAKPIIVPARSPDQWIDVQVDLGLKEDRYLQAVETKPIQGFRVVHHAVSSMLDGSASIGNVDGGTLKGPFLNEYAVGKNGDIFPEGAGRLIKAGTKINFNIHLHAINEETPASVAIALKLYPVGYVPAHVQITTGIGNSNDIDIRPNDPNARVDGYTVLTKPTRLLSFQPHMHLTGKAACLEAITPNGQKVSTLSCVSQYRFGWHITYMYADDVQPLLPPGTILHVITWHDNSVANKADPDPDNWKGWGERTVDDMSFVWCNYYVLSDDEFKQAVAEREAKNKMLSANQPGLR